MIRIVNFRWDSVQSMQCGGRATTLVFINNFGILTVYAVLLYYTNKTDGSRIVWCYPIGFTIGIPLGVLLLWWPLSEIWKKAKEEKMNLRMFKMRNTGVVEGATFVDEQKE